MSKTVFITGATSGIGEATAHRFADLKYHLILCGRNREKLNELEKSLGKQTKVHTLCFDVRDKKAVFAAVKSLPESFSNIDILINNAGNAHGLDSFQNADLEEIDLPIKRSKCITEFDGEKYDPRVSKCLRIFPQDNDTEGFFIAKIRKK